MTIQELSRDECLQVLQRNRLVRVACARDNQPYVLPMHVTVYQPFGDDPCFYGFTTIGQKVDWMRSNPLVCVEVDEIVASNEWISVVVFGRYEELSGAPGQEQERNLAHHLLQTSAVWWEPGSTVRTTPDHTGEKPAFEPVFYKIKIGKFTGKRATGNT